MLKYGVVFLAAVSMIWMLSCSGDQENINHYQKAYEQYNNGQYEEAIKNFKIVLENESQTENAKKALFMIGFINANHTKNLDEAKKYYEEFLQKYPNHELAASAKYELETLGQDINELSIFKDLDKEKATTEE